MSAKTKRRFNFKYFFYWFLAASLTAWGWAFLYLHSADSTWGTWGVTSDRNRREIAVLVNQVQNLETFKAPPEELFTKRMELAGHLDEEKEYKKARAQLDNQKKTDEAEPESEELLVRRIKLEEFRAHTYLEEAEFGEPKECYKRALLVAEQIASKYDKDRGRLFKASLTNELGIVSYYQGSCLIAKAQRKQLFDESRALFNDAIRGAELDAQDNQTPLKTCNLAADIKRHAEANLRLVEEDQRYEPMFDES